MRHARALFLLLLCAQTVYARNFSHTTAPNRGADRGRLVHRASAGQSWLMEILPLVGSAGWPTGVSDLCAYASSAGLLVGDAYCLRGDGTTVTTGTPTTFTTIGTVPTVTVPVCDQGNGCTTASALHFDQAQSGHLETANRTVKANDFTWCAYVQRHPDNAQRDFFAAYESGKESFRFFDSYYARADIIGTPSTTTTGSVVYSVTTWTPLCVSYDYVGAGTSVMRFYIDSGTVTTSSSSVAAMTGQASTKLSLGGRTGGSSAVRWKGLIRAFMFTETVLSDSQVAGWMTAARGAAFTGTKGESITVTRATPSSCPIGDNAFFPVPAGRACITDRGIAGEPSGTNVVIRSEELDNAVWTKTGVTVAAPTVTANQALFPDNAVIAERVEYPAVANSGEASLVYGGTFAFAAATTYATSVYVKASSGTPTLYLSLNSGTTYITTACSTNATTWSRCQMSNVGDGVAKFLLLGTDRRTGSAMPATPAATFFIGGVQHEVSTLGATSYMRTEGSSATRNSTSLPFAPPSGFSDTEGCVAATIQVPYTPTAGSRVIGTGSSSGPLNTVAGGTGFGSFDGTSTVASPAGASYVNVSARGAAGWRAGDSSRRATSSGGTATGAYDGTLLSGNLFIGSQAGTSNFLNGWAKGIVLGATRDGCQ